MGLDGSRSAIGMAAPDAASFTLRPMVGELVSIPPPMNICGKACRK